MTRRIAVVLAAAALFTGGVARAQSHRQPGQTPPPASEGERRRPNIPWVGGDRPATQPAPAPAPQQQPPAQPGTAQATQGGQGQWTQEQLQMLGVLKGRNAILNSMALLASQRGQSNEVKSYGQKLAQQAAQVDAELSGLLQERGGNANALPQPTEELRSNHDRATRLQSVQADQFDREFAQAVRDLGRQYEADLKRMRDTTPGKDARLKSWLDQTENVAEDYRLGAQQLIDRQNAQRQARTPPSSTGR
jgi:putative membrane protein